MSDWELRMIDAENAALDRVYAEDAVRAGMQQSARGPEGFRGSIGIHGHEGCCWGPRKAGSWYDGWGRLRSDG